MSGGDSGTEVKRGRVRSWLARRSLTERIVAVVAIAVVATVPFGGWRSAAETDAKPLKLHQRLDLGPYYAYVESLPTIAQARAGATSSQPSRRPG